MNNLFGYEIPPSPPWLAGRTFTRGGSTVRDVRRRVIIPNQQASAKRKRRYAAKVSK